jgi:sugar fermentation stimulation protein A
MGRSNSGLVTFGPLLSATFVARPNRFLIVARRGRQRILAACRDPGRLEALLRPGVELRLLPARPGRRRTAFDVALVRCGRTWTSLVPVLANRILEAALAAGHVPGLSGARVLAREPAHGRGRFDFRIAHRGRRVLTEVKSVGLVVDGRALFPDAPTARGTRHVRALARHVRRGGSGLLVFVAQRSDAASVAPCRTIDPDFGHALAEARRSGVRLLAFNCDVSPAGCRLRERIPVLLR